MKAITPEATLQQITSVNRSAMDLLVSIGLDVTEQSEKTLRQVCSEKQWSEVEVLNWLKKNQVIQKKTIKRVSDMKTDVQTNHRIPEICNTMISEIHPLIRDYITDIRSNYSRLQKVHGTQYLWLKEAEQHVQTFSEAMILYLKFEKMKFLPLARQLDVQKERTLDGDVQSLKRSVEIVEKDHKRLGAMMNRIRKISRDFYFDESACSSLRILCRQFWELFERFEEHVAIEKKILLPEIRRQIREL